MTPPGWISRDRSRGRIAFCTTESITPSRARSPSVATTMNRASTSKNSRRDARPSLRPKPSVPSDVIRRGIQRSIESAMAFT
jgi:hypothetical protein